MHPRAVPLYRTQVLTLRASEGGPDGIDQGGASGSQAPQPSGGSASSLPSDARLGRLHTLILGKETFRRRQGDLELAAADHYAPMLAPLTLPLGVRPPLGLQEAAGLYSGEAASGPGGWRRAGRWWWVSCAHVAGQLWRHCRRHP